MLTYPHTRWDNRVVRSWRGSSPLFDIRDFVLRLFCKRQVYDEHYKLAMYVTPSRCDDEVCNSARIRLPAAETLPCRQPLDMPTGFLDSRVPKNQTLNFTIFALEDVLLKVRILELFASRPPALSHRGRGAEDMIRCLPPDLIHGPFVFLSRSLVNGRRKFMSCMDCSRRQQPSSEIPQR